jgi:hypothetical protein
VIAAALARRDRHVADHTWWIGRVGLAAVLLVYALLGVLWSLSVPLGEGPDEPAHLRYALFLREHRRLPVQQDDPAAGDVPGEGHQPPLAYLLMQPFLVGLEDTMSSPNMYGNPAFRWNGGTEPNAYLHGAAERPPFGGLMLAWHLARLGSVGIGLGSVLLCWATVRRLWPDAPGLALGAAAVLAWTPQWLFHHALVSNDPLMIGLASLLIYQSVAAAQGTALGRRAMLHAMACGCTLGLMLITKQSALAFVPLPLLAWWLGRRDVWSWLRQSVLLIGTTTLIAGWWYLRNWRLYGDPLGLQVFQATFAVGDFRLDAWQDWREGAWNLLRSSWGAFGWFTLPLPDGAYVFAGMTLAFGLAGLLTSAGTSRWDGRGRALAVLVLAIVLVVAWTATFAVTAGMVAWQGRFLFPAAPALATLLAVGFATAVPRQAGLWPAVLLGLVLSSVLPFTLIRPAYATPALQADEVPRGTIFHRFDVGWKRGIELHDATFDRTVVGDELPVSFTWHLAEPVDRAWTVFLHLVDAEDEIVAKVDAMPLGGRAPTNTWVPGDWFRDEHRLSLAGVPPGTYRLRVGFFDPATGERLRVYGAGMDLLGDTVELGDVRVR